MITLRFVAHPGLFNWACRIAQYGLWPTHCDAVLPDGRLLGSRFVGGVQARSALYDAGDFTRELRVRIISTQAQEDAFYAFLNDQLDKPFDSLAIIAFITGRDWQAPDSWFCSELQAAALVATGLFPNHMAVGFNHISVRDLLLLASTLTEGD